MKTTLPYIEIIGLPGVGKSTILDAIADTGVNTNIVERWPETPRKLYFLTSLVSLLLQLIIKSPSIFLKPKNLKTNWWIISKIAYRLASLKSKPANYKAVLRDSGILQPLISFPAEYGGNQLDLALVESLLKTLPIPIKVVIITAELGTAKTRYLNRQKQTQRRSEYSVSSESYLKAYDTQKVIYEHLLRKDIQIHILNLDGAINDLNKTKLIKFLDS